MANQFVFSEVAPKLSLARKKRAELVGTPDLNDADREMLDALMQEENRYVDELVLADFSAGQIADIGSLAD